MRITVPATSANVGPGFDSVGIAVSKYLTIDVLEARENWWIEHDLGEEIPSNEENLLLQTALQVSSDLPPHHLKMVSEVPLARGLGSSSSVIVAGIELANQLGKLSLSDEDKLEIATKIEGHPDNVAPAIFGNLVVASYVDQQTNHLVLPFPECALVAFVPNYELKTSDSRNVLPSEWTYKEAVAASSIANVAIVALAKGDLRVAGKAIEADRFHERYRQQLVSEFPQVKEVAHQHDAYATYLSGAGPTIMTLLPVEHAEAFAKDLESKGLNGQVFSLNIDTTGVKVENSES